VFVYNKNIGQTLREGKTMQHWYTVAEKMDGAFKVVHSWTYEDVYPGDCFDDTCYDIKEMCRKIDAGIMDWFVARVQYFYDDVEMGSDYLGGCLYDSVDKAFAGGLDGYLEDMEDRAREEAQKRAVEMLDRLKQDFLGVDTAAA
jgi:hypothetical protein